MATWGRNRLVVWERNRVINLTSCVLLSAMFREMMRMSEGWWCDGTSCWGTEMIDNQDRLLGVTEGERMLRNVKERWHLSDGGTDTSDTCAGRGDKKKQTSRRGTSETVTEIWRLRKRHDSVPCCQSDVSGSLTFLLPSVTVRGTGMGGHLLRLGGGFSLFQRMMICSHGEEERVLHNTHTKIDRHIRSIRNNCWHQSTRRQRFASSKHQVDGAESVTTHCSSTSADRLQVGFHLRWTQSSFSLDKLHTFCKVSWF